MEESVRRKVFQGMMDKDRRKEDCERELRAMELQAYSSMMDAMRADGKLDKEKRGIMDLLRKHFNISEARHIAECRRVNSTESLVELSEGLRDGDGEDGVEESWAVEAYGTFPRLPPFHRRLGTRRDNPPVSSTGEDVWDKCIAKLRAQGYKIDLDKFPPEEEVGLRVASNIEAELARIKWEDKSRKSKVHKKTQTKVSTLLAAKKGNNLRDVDEALSSDEYEGNMKKERSPDIIDAASPTRNNSFSSTRRGVATKVTTNTGRGAKRKVMSAEYKRRQLEKSRLKINRKLNFGKGGGQANKFPKIKLVVRAPTVEQDSEEDIKNGPYPVPQYSPQHTVTASISPPSCPPISAGRGRGVKGQRGRGAGRGRGRGRIIPQQANMTVDRQLGSTSPIRQGSQSPMRSYPPPPSSPNRVKVLKPKKPVSLSRRKSRLREKDDDNMQVEWNDDDDEDEDSVIMSNKHVPVKKRKLLSEGGTADVELDYDRGHIENGETHTKDHHHRPHGHGYNNYLNPNDTVLSRNEICQRSPHLSGEDTDSASEKGSVSGGSRPGGNGNGNNSHSSDSPPPQQPPVRQKQRLKSPLIPTALPRITIPPPVFNPNLNNAQKNKRPQKHVSVVDSLNLHLPTTPTASSLASSARRQGMGSGPGIFSNQAMVLARQSGSPGILQTSQRKATPHILSNSKMQRTFIPTTSTSVTVVNSTTMGLSLGLGGIGSSMSMSLPTNCSSTYSMVNANSTGTILGHSSNVNVLPNMPNSPAIVQLPSSSSVSSAQITMSGCGTIPLTSVSRASTPIILVQKAKTPITSTTPTSIGTSNTILLNLTRIQDDLK